MVHIVQKHLLLLVHQIIWHHKLYLVKDIQIMLIYGHLVLLFINLWLDMYHLVNKQKILIKFINKY